MRDALRRSVKKFDVRTQFLRSLPESGAVLDIGCGTGLNGRMLQAHHPGIQISGVDLLERDQVPPFYDYRVVNLEAGTLPFPDASFDAVVCTHVLEHLHAPVRIGREINRVMKIGARIYLETPNWTSALAPSFGFRREQHNPFNFYDDPSHVRPWSLHGLFEFLAQGCRLRVVRVSTVRNWLRVPLDTPLIVYGLLSGRRSLVVSSFWNLYGWCIYAIGVKDADGPH